MLVVVIGCGNSATTPDGSPDTPSDVPASQCEPLGAIGQFARRANNPRLVAGHQFPDGKLDISISDPDVHREAGVWQLYYAAAHTMAYSDPEPHQLIRHATSVDRVAWSVDDVPALEAGAAGAWDALNTETPTVVMNPNAPADRRYLMLYSGAAQKFPFPGYAFADYAIGAAFSADGKTFTRASASPVLRGSDVYPGVTGAIVADPELVIEGGVYHLFYSSFACLGASCETIAAYGVGHSTSSDGLTWTTVAAPITSLLRASSDPRSGGSQPSVVYDVRRCQWELWQKSDLAAETDVQPAIFNNMAGVWHADSSDALTWHIDYARARDLTWSASEPGEQLGLLTGADVGGDDTGRLMLYVGLSSAQVPADFYLPDHSVAGFGPGVMTLNVATRDLQ